MTTCFHGTTFVHTKGKYLFKKHNIAIWLPPRSPNSGERAFQQEYIEGDAQTQNWTND